jgi:hypothetical protein
MQPFLTAFYRLIVPTAMLLPNLITETMNKFLYRNIIQESKNSIIRINEQQLHRIVSNVLTKLAA